MRPRICDAARLACQALPPHTSTYLHGAHLAGEAACLRAATRTGRGPARAQTGLATLGAVDVGNHPNPRGGPAPPRGAGGRRDHTHEEIRP